MANRPLNPRAPPVKMLKVRPDGRLLSPKQASAEPKKRSSKQEQDLDSNGLTIIKYGKKKSVRLAIGQRIDAILNESRNPLSSLKVSGNQDVVDPSKPTHPFFGGTSKSTVKTPRLDQKSRAITEKQPTADLVPKVMSTFSSDHARLLRFPGAQEPMWPSKGMVRVEPSLSPSCTVPATVHKPRKSKTKQVFIPLDEEVLRPFELVAIQCNAESTRKLRPPRRRIMTGDDLQQQVQQQMTDPFRHAVKHIFDNIPLSRSAFARFTYEQNAWSDKYAPRTSRECLQDGQDVILMADWLRSSLMVRPERPARKKKRKRVRELADFMVSSDEDEDSFTPGNETTTRDGNHNTIVVSGPHGCGKSAAVYAICRELGFEVFEINAGTRRSGKDILGRVGSMTENHLVRHETASDSELSPDAVDSKLAADIQSGRQGTMQSFFGGSKPKKADCDKVAADSRSGCLSKDVRQSVNQNSKAQVPGHRTKHKQSVILLEEVDVLFEEDKMFWSTVLELAHTSKRPIILTCTDERLVPLENLPLHGIFRLQRPSMDLAVDYLLAVAASEDHLLDRDSVKRLYQTRERDFRACLQELQFHCQMALGDAKAGLDWMLTDQASTSVQAISEYTYLNHPTSEILRKSEVSEDEDALCQGFSRNAARVRNYEALGCSEITAETCSATDILPASRQKTSLRSLMDLSQPALSAQERLQYVEGYSLLQTDVLETGISMDVVDIVQKSIATPPQPEAEKSSSASRTAWRQVLAPLNDDASTTSLDGPLAVVAEEIAPYVRGMVSYDLQLENMRQQLSEITTQRGRDGGKLRKTRASLAALEGGTKATTRRDRWFPLEMDYAAVLSTC